MRALFGSIASLITLTTPAAANGCYWINGGYINCDATCRVTQRWFDGSREWMRYECGPPPELIAIAAVAVLIIIVGVVGLINSIRSSNSYQADIQQVEHYIAKDDDIKHDMENAMHRADAHIAAMLAKYRKGDDHG